MENKQIAVILAGILIVASLGVAVYAFSKDSNNSNSYDLNKDAVGRDVVIPGNIDDGIVTIGVGTMRWVSYFGLEDSVVIRDMNDTTNYMGKSYLYAVGGVLDLLPSTAQTSSPGTLDTPDVSNILNLTKKPIVIISDSVYNQSKIQVTALEKGGINVCVIYELEDYIDTTSFKVTEKFEYQAKLVGKILRSSDRADELIEGINDIITDIRDLVKDVTPVKGYIGALSYSGAKTAVYSSGSYLPFDLANVDNVLSDNNFVAGYSVSYLTSIINADTVVFIDANGNGTLRSSGDNESSALIKTFEANGNDGYIAFPYVWYGLNFDNVLIGAYQIISYIYGSVLSETHLTQRVNAVFDLFYDAHTSTRTRIAAGVPAPTETTSIYNDMSNQFLNSTSAANGWKSPLYGEVVFKSDGTITNA